MTYSIYLERETETADEVDARHSIVNLFSDRGLTADADGYIEVATDDGGHAQVHVGNGKLLAFNEVGLSRDLVALMFPIAQRGYRVFAENSSHALTTFPARVRDASSEGDWPIVLCPSPDAMYDALMEPFEEWVEYRDQVVSDASQGVVRRLMSRVLRR